jgi:tRNA (cytidine/uridine-2'-O-)-methyltransferase
MGAAAAVRLATHAAANDANAMASFQCRRKRAPERCLHWRGYGLPAASVKVVLTHAAKSPESPAVPRTSSTTPRLRAKPLGTPLHVVLVEPEIPPNTGNVARLCAATGSPLHLVGTLGFRIDEHSVRRAGVDYWHLVDVRQHVSFEHFLHAWQKESPTGRLHLFSALATTSYLEATYTPGDALVFGRESVGLPEELTTRFADRVIGIPTLGAVRSLNLANAAGIALFEALRATGALAATYTG